MLYFVINWVLSVMALLVVAGVMPGCRVTGFESVLIASGIVGLVSAGLGSLLKHAHEPVLVFLAGMTLLIVDATLFRLSALIVPGFAMRGFAPAAVGSLVLLALNAGLLRVPLRDNPLETETWAESVK